jgi:adenylosuccinate lyase
MNNFDSYQSPFSTRYCSSEMQELFSARKKFTTWRRLWVLLAEAERELGLNITLGQIAELRSHINITDAELVRAGELERELRHDVMAHVHAYGETCPSAAGIIHLGATSCYVTDNTDIIIMREALHLLASKLAEVITKLAEFAQTWKAEPTLGFTHFQPAQLTTVGKRATLWLQDFLLDLRELERRAAELLPRGVKGTTGTQASFMELFSGDSKKVKQLDKLVSEKMGFDEAIPVSGQTYTRKLDYYVVSALSGLAQSAGKFATDMRLLSHLKELEEPFEDKQVGSSAMPYKRNPMRCERICALSRYLITDALNPALTAYNQWFERTLDDSANRRISLAEAFLCADAIINVLSSVCFGIQVNPRVIERHLNEELPFMATENIMMRAVKQGGDRQVLHEQIRIHSKAAGNAVKREGLPNDLISRIAADPLFNVSEAELSELLLPELYIGRAAEQVTDFVTEHVTPALTPYQGKLVKAEELSV